MLTIQDYINDKNLYVVDKTYQRPNNVWSREDKQCLIDTILKNEPIPIFFFNYIDAQGIYYVVDGQQRLNAIHEFYHNKIKLNRKFSGDDRHGQTFNGESPISQSDKQKFLNYSLSVKIAYGLQKRA